MQQPQQKKSSVVPVVILVIVLALIAYFYISSRSSDTLLQSQAKPGDGVVGKDLLAALNRLSALRLDSAIFTDRQFLSLQDFSVELVAQPVGRDNPFLPLAKTSSDNSSGALKKAIQKK